VTPATEALDAFIEVLPQQLRLAAALEEPSEPVVTTLPSIQQRGAAARRQLTRPKHPRWHQPTHHQRESLLHKSEPDLKSDPDLLHAASPSTVAIPQSGFRGHAAPAPTHDR
jgi:hypothetical protein